MRRNVILVLTALTCACLVGSASARAASTSHTWAAYQVGPMETCVLNGDCDDDITAWDINAKGWVAGEAFPDYHWPWTWHELSVPTPTSPGHTTTGDFTDTGFLAINSKGDTAGYTSNEQGGDPSETQAILHTSGGYTLLGTLQGSTGDAWAYAVNDADTVVGGSTTNGGTEHAFMWTAGGGMVDLGTLGGADSWATSLNGSTQIVGWAEVASGKRHAALWQNGSAADLGTLGGAESAANSINQSGEIVGWADTKAGAQHAFIRTGSKLVDIGKLLTGATSSVANDVDNNGDVVGTAQGPNGEFSWLYTGGSMINLQQHTVTWGDIAGGALNTTLQIVPRGETTSVYAPVLEPVAAYDETSARIHYTGTWTRSAHAGAWRGHVKTATQAGATASFTFTGRRIWWIAPVGTYGKARVYVDGALKSTVDLGNGSGDRQTAFVQAFAGVGTHTIKIVVLSTPGRTRVAIDAFAVSQH